MSDPTIPYPPPTVPPSTSSQAAQQTKLQRTRQNLTYLVSPSSSTSPAPTSLRTRTLLRSAHYTLRFIFWRLVRYAKYAAIGSLTALVAGTAIGSVVSGVGFIIAPTGILGGATVGLLWGVGKFGWRRFARKARDGKVGGGDARGDERADARGDGDGDEDGDRGLREVVERREERGLRADPW